MSCDRTAGDLVAYHFGVVEGGTRERLEAHLLECRACLESFLALKRDIELSAMSEAARTTGAGHGTTWEGLTPSRGPLCVREE
jgi:hypothetical protein